MQMPPGSAPSVQTVIAAQAGDGTALDSLLSGYLPLVYNIVGRALRGHPDTDDVVQETMLRVVRGLADLRDPAAFRSWLVAVTIRQVRDYRNRPVVPGGGLRPDLPDPGADFVDLAILRLGLSSQRRETAEATRWLDVTDRELLALWWLEAGGQIERSEVAAALGLPPGHVAVRIARMKEQLTTARVLVRALGAAPACGGLSSAAEGWDRRPSPLWRKRLARHTRDCQQCGAQYEGLIPADRLLAGLPLIPAPIAVGTALLTAVHQFPAAGPPPAARHAGTGHAGAGHGGTGQAGARRVQAGHSGGGASRPVTGHGMSRLRHARLLAKTGGAVPAKIAAVSVAAVVAAAGTFAVVHRHAPAPDVVSRSAASRPMGPRPAVTYAPPAAPAHARLVTATSSKKGVSAWTFPGARKSLRLSGASWFYTWAAGPNGVSSPRGVKFVPMIWGPGSVTAANLSEASKHGHILLGFNEPDMASQSNMTVSDALRLWPQLMATGMKLGSPAVATNAAGSGSWLDRFMRGARSRHYRVSFITLHWYGGNFATGAAVSELKSYIQAVWARYHKPIWLTEFALMNFGTNPVSYPAPQQQAAFVTASTAMLQGLPYVHRYAWFALPSNTTDGTVGLFRAGAHPTRPGRAFEAAGR
jgi:RNA polymerase sigma factor (sigma-70 family)